MLSDVSKSTPSRKMEHLLIPFPVKHRVETLGQRPVFLKVLESLPGVDIGSSPSLLRILSGACRLTISSIASVPFNICTYKRSKAYEGWSASDTACKQAQSRRVLCLHRGNYRPFQLGR
jgi:hypothetical protein